MLDPTLNPRQRVAKALLLQKSYADFVRYFWPIVEPGTKLVWNWHLDVICQHLQDVTAGRIKKLVVEVPPGTMKSSLTSVFWSAFEWLEQPHLRTLVASYDMNLVLRDNMKCRRIVESEEYKEILGILIALKNSQENRQGAAQYKVWGMAPDQNQKGYFENAQGGFRQCVTVGGSAPGKRGDKTVVDDPVKITDLVKADPKRRVELMAEVANWFNNIWPSRLNDQATGQRVVIMQRVHELDLAGLLEKDPDWHVLRLPMTFDPKRADPDDPRTEPGELLFPIKFPLSAIEALRKQMTPDQWLAQYEQQPIPAEGKLLKQEYFRNTYRYVAGHWRSNPNLPEMRRVTIHWDFAQKAKQTSDPTVGLVMGEGPSGEIYLLDLWRRRQSFDVLEAEVPLYIDTHNPNWVTIEDTAAGTGMIAILVNKQRRKNIITIQQPKDGKYVRMAVQTPWLSRGMVWVPDPTCPWMYDFLSECLAFPDGPNDDQVDGLSQGLQWIFDNPLDRQGTHTYRVNNGERTFEEGEASPPAAVLEQLQHTPTVSRQALEEAAIAQMKAQMRALMGR